MTETRSIPAASAVRGANMATVLVSLLVLTVAAGCAGSRPQVTERKKLVVSHKTVAEVNGMPITQAELDLAVRQVQEERISVIAHRSLGLSRDGRPATPEDIAMERLVNEKLLLQEAARRELSVTDKEVDSYLNGMKNRYVPKLTTVFRNARESKEFVSVLRARVHDELLKNKLKRDVFSKIKVSGEEVQNFYDENRDIYIKDATFRVQHLFIKAPRNAAQELQDKAARKASILRSMILRGGDFGDLARKHSDDVHTADRGGDMGYFRKSIPMPGVHNEAFKLREGQVSDVISKPDGHHLLRVSEIKDIEMRPLYAVYDEIVYRLRVQKNITAAQELIILLRRDAAVKVE